MPRINVQTAVVPSEGAENLAASHDNTPDKISSAVATPAAVKASELYKLPKQVKDVSQCPGSFDPGPMADLAMNTTGTGDYLLNYRRVFPLQRYGSEESPKSFLPIYALYPLDAVPESVTSTFIYNHGYGGYASQFFCKALAMVQGLGIADKMQVIAPFFGASSPVAASFWEPSQTIFADGSTESLYWKTVWRGGSSNVNKGDLAEYTDSFTAADRMIELIIAGASPNMKKITYSGFSAGAQFTMRYAMLSDVDVMAGDAGIDLQFIFGDPGSYTYLDEKRPAKSCRPLVDSGIDHTCTDFETVDVAAAEVEFPSVEPGVQAAVGKSPNSDCSKYDDWYYGFKGFEAEATKGAYMIAEYASGKRDLASAKDAYGKKKVRVILGNQDVCNCARSGMINHGGDVCYPQVKNYCSPNLTLGGKPYNTKYVGGWYNYTDGTLHPGVHDVPEGEGIAVCCDTLVTNTVDARCQGMLQGSNRLQRGLNWYARAEQLYGDALAWKKATFVGNHDDAPFIMSKEFKEWGFGV